MAWTLLVYDETGTTIERTITESLEKSGIDGGFRVVVRGSGDCVSLTFRGRNDLLQIRVRQIVKLTYGVNDIFWGVITRAPNLASPGAGPEDSSIISDLEDFAAEGGRNLIANSTAGPKYVSVSTEVADIFRDFLTLYGPSQLTSDLTAITNTLSVLTLFYKPSAQLDEVLDELISTVDGWVWGVNAQGKVFLKELTGLQEFAATELVDFYFKAVSGEDVVTKVNLVISGSPSGRIPDGELHFVNDPTLYNSSGNGEADARIARDYVPMPVVHSYEHPSHATYGAERTFALPPGIVPFLEPSAVAALPGMTLADVSGNWTNEPNMYDGNDSTFASATLATWSLLRWTYLATGADPALNQKIVGFRFVYSAQIASASYGDADLRNNPHVRLYRNVVSPDVPGTPSGTYSASVDDAVVSERYYLIRSTYDVAAGINNKGAMHSVMPLSADFLQDNLDSPLVAESCHTHIDIFATGVTGTTRLYHYYPLVLDSALLDEVAKSNINLPSTLSGDVVVLGYNAPTPVVRVVNLFGSPVGSPPSTDMYESVETVEYTMNSQEGFATKYTLGNDATSDAAVLLKRYVRDGITAANYALTMGSVTRT